MDLFDSDAMQPLMPIRSLRSASAGQIPHHQLRRRTRELPYPPALHGWRPASRPCQRDERSGASARSP